jgi:hypothetical protein
MTLYGSIAMALAAGLLASAPALAQDYGRHTVGEGACFYYDADYRGRSFCVEAGDESRSIPDGLEDRISSIRIFGRVEVTVYKDKRLKGDSRRFDRDVRNLRDEGWNDRISSLSVDRRHGGFGGGYGPRPPYGDPDRIVRRAYEDVLGRQPDADGLRLYRSRMIDDGWTEAQVRDALRNSAEYREKATMTYPKAQEMVRAAYRNVFNREPDSASRGYIDKVLRDHWTQADVERDLRKSPEYHKH